MIRYGNKKNDTNDTVTLYTNKPIKRKKELLKTNIVHNKNNYGNAGAEAFQGVPRNFRGISEHVKSVSTGSQGVSVGLRGTQERFKKSQGVPREFQGIPGAFHGFSGAFQEFMRYQEISGTLRRGPRGLHGVPGNLKHVQISLRGV